MKKIIIIFLNLPIFLYAGDIQSFELIDGFSRPLESQDDGISFQYNLLSYGEINVYLQTLQETYNIISNEKEIKGNGIINISAYRLLQLYNNIYLFNSILYLYLTHVSIRTNKYSEEKLSLNLFVEAPYGNKLLDYPPKPNLYNTDTTKSIIQPLPLIGVISGYCLLATGALLYLFDQEKIDYLTKGIILDIGVVLVLLCNNYLYETIPDEEINNKNRLLNQKLLIAWEIEYNKITALNEKIKTTFIIRITLQ